MANMEALDLDPGDYRGTYKLIGGRMALDLVNTVSWPDTERRHDWLGSAGNVERWLKAAGISAPAIGQSELAPIRALRTTITAVLRPLCHGSRPPGHAVDALNVYLRAAHSRRLIGKSKLVWTWLPPRTAMDAFGPVVLDAADLVTGGRHDRLRACPPCDWLFEDQSRNGLRRWCDMADCGSRDKSNRYYHRHT
jgi:predicted RNA-binding Zn ribbon-like protein